MVNQLAKWHVWLELMDDGIHWFVERNKVEEALVKMLLF